MIDLEARLSELGDLLAIDDDVAGDVLAVLAARPAPTRRSIPLRVAAGVLLLVAAVVAIVPSARDSVAGWLGLERVEIQRRDDLIVPDSLPPITVPNESAAETPVASTSPIGEQAIVADGTAVLLGTIDGRLSDAFIGKIVSADAPVVGLVIDGMPALWIEEPHEVLIERGGQPVVERIAGSTLLWQDGDVLWRVEGFATLDDAVDFARSR